MKTAYFHCFSGISGDMCLGALLDAGAPFNSLKRDLKKLGLKGYTVSLSEEKRAGLRASKVTVNVRETTAGAKKLRDVRAIINGSSLTPTIKRKGLNVFQKIFEAEALVHGTTPGRTHLHELGAVDAMVDIMGTIICLDLLGIERVACSEINLGSGTVDTSHGTLPVPAPATTELLKGVPVYSEGRQELTTPTGAALMSSLAGSFGSMTAMRVEATGTGAGERDFPGRANVLRVLVGTTTTGENSDQNVTVIETNIDDMSPEVYGHVMDLLFEAGALDVWMTPVIMKKSRPAILLSAICQEHEAPALMEIILKETTTLGLRHYSAGRVTLERSTRRIKTVFGNIMVKDAFLGGRHIKSSPEYEDARRAARKHGVSLRDVMEAAIRAIGDKGTRN
jgi:uncharacterized protein (TIGR00299 family) protein